MQKRVPGRAQTAGSSTPITRSANDSTPFANPARHHNTITKRAAIGGFLGLSWGASLRAWMGSTQSEKASWFFRTTSLQLFRTPPGWFCLHWNSGIVPCSPGKAPSRRTCFPQCSWGLSWAQRPMRLGLRVETAGGGQSFPPFCWSWRPQFSQTVSSPPSSPPGWVEEQSESRLSAFLVDMPSQDSGRGGRAGFPACSPCF